MALRQQQCIIQQENLWWDDQPTDDPVPNPDPQSGDVTDGSVDYFDFDWGEMVVHPESVMERRLFTCDSFCSSSCFGGDGTENDCGGDNGDPNGEDTCGTDGSCVENRPSQTDQNLYEIVSE